jgi:hypothetical protein
LIVGILGYTIQPFTGAMPMRKKTAREAGARVRRFRRVSISGAGMSAGAVLKLFAWGCV